jgi:hypothetical protein
LLDEEREEKVYKISLPGLVINSRATISCTPELHLFTNLDPRYKGRLGTTAKDIPIQGKEDILIPLPNSPPAKICGVLFVPIMRETLLST